MSIRDELLRSEESAAVAQQQTTMMDVDEQDEHTTETGGAQAQAQTHLGAEAIKKSFIRKKEMSTTGVDDGGKKQKTKVASARK